MTRAHDDIAGVLAGEASYDALPGSAQAEVRAVWDERIREATEAFDLGPELRAAGTPWPEADASGALVWRQPSPGSGVQTDR